MILKNQVNFIALLCFALNFDCFGCLICKFDFCSIKWFFSAKKEQHFRDQRYHQAQNNDEFVVKSHLASLRQSDIIEIFAFVLLSLILYMLYYYRRECKV